MDSHFCYFHFTSFLPLIVILSPSFSKEEPPPFPFPLSFHSPAWCPGVFLEVNEKRNLNCLSLKGMSGSTGWKLVLLMSFAFSVWVGHLWGWVCLMQFRAEMLWLEGTWREGGWAYETDLHLQEGESGGGGGSVAYLAYFRSHSSLVQDVFFLSEIWRGNQRMVCGGKSSCQSAWWCWLGRGADYWADFTYPTSGASQMRRGLRTCWECKKTPLHVTDMLTCSLQPD